MSCSHLFIFLSIYICPYPFQLISRACLCSQREVQSTRLHGHRGRPEVSVEHCEDGRSDAAGRTSRARLSLHTPYSMHAAARFYFHIGGTLFPALSANMFWQEVANCGVG